MSDTNQNIDEKKGDDVLAKMLKTKPKPKEKDNEENDSKNSR
jgi:hypothetical protein